MPIRLIAVLLGLLLAFGCSTTGRFTVGVENQTDKPISVGFIKDGPPLEAGWTSPVQIAIGAPQSSDSAWGIRLPPGEAAVLGPQSGRFQQGVTAYLRVYQADWTVQELLAIGADSPNRLDIPLDNGRSDWIIHRAPAGLTATPASRQPPPTAP